MACLEIGWRVLEIPQDQADYRLFVNNLARTSVSLISTVFACLFLAIPLTANMFTPQLIENFWRAKSNRWVLGLYVFSAGNAIWLSHLPADPIPSWHARFAFALVVLSLLLLLPYLFSVFRLIDPHEIVARVAQNVDRALRPGLGSTPTRQAELERRIQDLGSIVLRMLDRADRDGAKLGVDAIESCLRTWLGVKDRHESSFFLVDSDRFPGLSPAAIRLMNDERTWVETAFFVQLSRAYGAALEKAPDVIGSIARALRHVAVEAADLRRVGAVTIALRWSNNFLREAIKRHDIHAVYDLLHQQSQMLLRLWSIYPERVVEVARRLDYYARMAFTQGMPFARTLVVCDLGRVVASVDAREARFEELLDAFMVIGSSDSDDVGVVESRLVTAARLHAAGNEVAARRIADSLEGVPLPSLQRARADIESCERWFFEVTDRQENLFHLEEGERQALGVLMTPIIERAESGE